MLTDGDYRREFDANGDPEHELRGFSVVDADTSLEQTGGMMHETRCGLVTRENRDCGRGFDAKECYRKDFTQTGLNTVDHAGGGYRQELQTQVRCRRALQTRAHCNRGYRQKIDAGGDYRRGSPADGGCRHGIVADTESMQTGVRNSEHNPIVRIEQTEIAEAGLMQGSVADRSTNADLRSRFEM